jgi:hypothetical protein
LDVANTAWAFASASYFDKSLFFQLGERVDSLGPGAFRQPSQLVAVLWAFARSAHVGRLEACAELVLDRLKPCVVAAAPQLKPYEVASLLWAYARARRGSKEVHEALAARGVEIASDFLPRDVGRVAWACGEAGHRSKWSRELLAAIQSSLEGRAAVAKFQDLDLVLTVWGSARTGVAKEGFIGALADEVRPAQCEALPGMACREL